MYYASEEDESAVRAIVAWQEEACEAFYDIEGWRNSGERRDWTDPHAQAPPMFLAHTTWVLNWITVHHPRLDPKPLQDIYDAVTAWYQDRRADRLPPQSQLQRTLDQAIMLIQAAKAAIDARADAAKPEHDTPPDTSPRWVTRQQAADATALDLVTIGRAVDRDDIRAESKAPRSRVDLDSVFAFAARRRAASRAETRGERKSAADARAAERALRAEHDRRRL